jgi:hypothetical protein
MNEDKPPKITRRSSLFWPLIFITLGVLFLLNNLGYIQGDIWNNLIRLWPLILMIIGLDSAYKGDGIVGAVLLLSVGCVFLLANLGYLAIDAWQVIIRLWPVLLIAIGLDILIGRRVVWLSLIGLALVLAILAGGIWYYGIQNADLRLSGKEISQALDGIEEAKIDLEPGVGQVKIGKTSADNLLFSGLIPEQIQIQHNLTQEGQKAIFTMRSGENSSFFLKGRENRWEWNFDFSPKPLLDLKLGLGVGSCRIDLTGLKMKALDVSLGVGDAQIIMPSEGQFQARVDGAIGQITIYLPENMELRVNSHTGLGNFKAPPEFMKIGDYYQSKGFDHAVNRVDLNVSQAIGVIDVRVITP